MNTFKKLILLSMFLFLISTASATTSTTTTVPMCNPSDCCSLYPGKWISCSPSGICLFSDTENSVQNYYCQSVTTNTTIPGVTTISTTIPGGSSTTTTISTTTTSATTTTAYDERTCIKNYQVSKSCSATDASQDLYTLSVLGHGYPPSVNCNETIPVSVTLSAVQTMTYHNFAFFIDSNTNPIGTCAVNIDKNSYNYRISTDVKMPDPGTITTGYHTFWITAGGNYGYCTPNQVENNVVTRKISLTISINNCEAGATTTSISTTSTSTTISNTIPGGSSTTTTWAPGPTTTSTSTTIPGGISYQQALDLANNAVQPKCGITYTQIEKIPWSKGGPEWYILQNICHDLKNYDYSEVWIARKFLNEIDCSPVITINCIEILTFVGINGEFVCPYGIYRFAAPGIVKLEDVCKSISTTSISTTIPLNCKSDDSSAQYPKGDDPFLSGSATPPCYYENGNIGTNIDNCMDSNSLDETYCPTQAGYCYHKIIKCSDYGNMKCMNGACVNYDMLDIFNLIRDLIDRIFGVQK